MHKRIDLTGQKFNKLTVLGFSHVNVFSFWDVRCDCGKELKVRGVSLKNNNTKSCGCLVSKHGFSGTPIYNVWNDLNQRCFNFKNSKYNDYGLRGITVCDKWLTFEGFYEDMGDKPEGKTLDRIDNNKGYSKENCKWSTITEQNNNKRSNKTITYKGKTQTITQWARELNINTSTFRNRVSRNKLSIEEIFESPVGSLYKRH